jgi:homoaconitate hydratase
MTARASTAAMMNPDHANHAFTHEKIADLMANKLTADPGAVYAKTLYINLSTLSPFVSGPNSVKVATPLKDLEAQDIKVDKA